VEHLLTKLNRQKTWSKPDTIIIMD